MAATPDLAAIKKQVEFYFSDSNYAKDKHLRAEAEKDEGYVSILHLLTFVRMKKLTQNPDDVIAALKDSEVVTIRTDNKAIKRVEPVTEEEFLTRKIYTKGWPKETVTIESITSFFAPHGNVRSVRVRKYLGTKNPKGSAVIEFDKDETATALLEKKPQPPGLDLTYQKMEDWMKEKAKQSELPQHYKKKQAKKQEEQEKTKLDFDGKVVKFGNIGPAQSRETLLQVFGEYGKVEFVDFVRNEDNGSVRYTTKEEAANMMEKMKGREIAGSVPTFALVEGEELKGYEERAQEVFEARKDKKGGKKGQKGGPKGKKGQKEEKSAKGKGKKEQTKDSKKDAEKGDVQSEQAESSKDAEEPAASRANKRKASDQNEQSKKTKTDAI